MKISNHSLIEESLERIGQIQSHQKSLYAIVQNLSGGHYGVKLDTGNLHEKLYESEANEWRNLFMWGLTIDDSTRERIKAAAYERFLADGISVAHHLNNGEHPGMWLASDENKFRAMAKKLFLGAKK